MINITKDSSVKKLAAVLAPLTLVLSACAATGTTGTGTSAATTTNSLAMMAVKVGVQAKCVTELNNNTYWKTASKVLTETQKSELQTEVCSCVGEKATTSVTATDLVVAAMDKTSQANLAAKIVTNTLNACVVETLKN
nr:MULTISPECIES: hypothetical protein [unclassified Acinetobacter]